MNTKRFSDAMNEVNNRYVDEAMCYERRRKKNSRMKWGILAACLCLAAIGFIAFINFDILNQSVSRKPTVSPHDTEKSSVASGGETVLYYSELTNTDDIVNEDILAQFAGITNDIVPFNEAALNDCAAIIEGEITNIRLKNYSFTVADDKFDEDGILNYNVSAVVYEIKVTKVWYGKIEAGSIIAVEDTISFCDKTFAIKTGHSYVIPVYEAGDTIWTFNRELIDGNIQRDSIYSIVYPFHPQIEAVEEGYIVSTEWETLTADEKSNIIVDVELDENVAFYKDKMLLIPTETFSEQMDILIGRIN